MFRHLESNSPPSKSFQTSFCIHGALCTVTGLLVSGRPELQPAARFFPHTHATATLLKRPPPPAVSPQA
eukprot:scaffold25595_cov60-Phaeocystis_antarctica.AAC.5